MTPLRTAIVAALSHTEWKTARDLCGIVEGWSWSTIRNELTLMAQDGLIQQVIDEISPIKVRARYLLREVACADPA